MLGEFGRTPKINAPGRPRPLARLLQRGAGRRRSDRRDAVRLERQDRGLSGPEPGDSPGDLAATIFWRFGLDPLTELHDVNGRPFRLAAGEPITKLFA